MQSCPHMEVLATQSERERERKRKLFVRTAVLPGRNEGGDFHAPSVLND